MKKLLAIILLASLVLIIIGIIAHLQMQYHGIGPVIPSNIKQ